MIRVLSFFFIVLAYCPDDLSATEAEIRAANDRRELYSLHISGMIT